MNERIDREELEALEGLIDVVFDAADWVKAMEGPSRWLVISGRFPGIGQRIVLETSRPARASGGTRTGRIVTTTGSCPR